MTICTFSNFSRRPSLSACALNFTCCSTQQEFSRKSAARCSAQNCGVWKTAETAEDFTGSYNDWRSNKFNLKPILAFKMLHTASLRRLEDSVRCINSESEGLSSYAEYTSQAFIGKVMRLLSWFTLRSIHVIILFTSLSIITIHNLQLHVLCSPTYF